MCIRDRCDTVGSQGSSAPLEEAVQAATAKAATAAAEAAAVGVASSDTTWLQKMTTARVTKIFPRGTSWSYAPSRVY